MPEGLLRRVMRQMLVESLTQRRRVEDEGLRVVNSCQWGREWTVPTEEALANYVPAAAVRRRE